MKPKKIDGVEVWKDFEDLAARLGLNVIERAVYSYLLLHTRLEGKPRLHFTLPELARCVRPSTRARAASAFIACAGFPAGPAASTTWCRASSQGKIRTAIWFPAARHATGKRRTTQQQISCASSTVRAACPPRTSAHAFRPFRTLRQASSGHRF